MPASPGRCSCSKCLGGEDAGPPAGSASGWDDDEAGRCLGLHVGSALRYLHSHGHRASRREAVEHVAWRAPERACFDLSIARAPGTIHAGVGTDGYLAPEQERGGEVGLPADVGGLAALLHGALAGRPPFGDEEDDDDGAAEFPCLVRRAVPLRSLRRGLPRALAGVLDGGLASDPGARPTLAALLDVLDEVAGRPAGPGRWVPWSRAAKCRRDRPR